MVSKLEMPEHPYPSERPTIDTTRAVLAQFVGKQVTAEEFKGLGIYSMTGVLQWSTKQGSIFELVGPCHNWQIYVGDVKRVRLDMLTDNTVRLYICLIKP